MVRYVDLITDAVQSGRKDDAAQSPASAIPESFFSRAAQAPAVKEPDSDRDVYLALWKQMQSIKAGIREKTGFDILPLKEQVRAIAGSPDLLDRLYHYTTRFGNEEDYTASHSINTMIYALKIALRLEYAPEDLEALGLAALLHDVGMFAVPDSILLKPEPLSPGKRRLSAGTPRPAATRSPPGAARCPGSPRRPSSITSSRTEAGIPVGFGRADLRVCEDRRPGEHLRGHDTRQAPSAMRVGPGADRHEKPILLPARDAGVPGADLPLSPRESRPAQ